MDPVYADKAFRAIPARTQAKYRQKAQRMFKQQDLLCPRCDYNLHGLFEESDALRPCPECGRAVSPGAVLLAWCHPRNLHLYRLITLLSGPAHAMVLGIGIFAALQLKQRPVSLVDALFGCWYVLIALHLILLLYSAWRMQRIDWPGRNPFLAAMIAVVYTMGNVITFVITWHVITLMRIP